jgi:hypothetical protein
MNTVSPVHRSVRVPVADAVLEADLAVPLESPRGAVLFAHGGRPDHRRPQTRRDTGRCLPRRAPLISPTRTLGEVHQPTLLIVGGSDTLVIRAQPAGRGETGGRDPSRDRPACDTPVRRTRHLGTRVVPGKGLVSSPLQPVPHHGQRITAPSTSAQRTERV